MNGYSFMIDIAFEKLVNVKYWYYSQENIVSIFGKTQEETTIIRTRKEKWIQMYIQENCFDTNRMKNIFEIIVVVAPNKKLDYINMLLKINREFSMFESVPLFPSTRSWSGSEVPIIERKIEFLQELTKTLNELDYLEHRNYLKNRIRQLEKYKQTVLKKEYIEEFSYGI